MSTPPAAVWKWRWIGERRSPNRTFGVDQQQGNTTTPVACCPLSVPGECCAPEVSLHKSELIAVIICVAGTRVKVDYCCAWGAPPRPYWPWRDQDGRAHVRRPLTATRKNSSRRSSSPEPSGRIETRLRSSVLGRNTALRWPQHGLRPPPCGHSTGAGTFQHHSEVPQLLLWLALDNIGGNAIIARDFPRRGGPNVGHACTMVDHESGRL